MLAELYVCSGLSFVMQCDRQNFKNSIKWLIRKSFNFLQDVFQYILKEVLKYNSSLEHHRVKTFSLIYMRLKTNFNNDVFYFYCFYHDSIT